MNIPNKIDARTLSVYVLTEVIVQKRALNEALDTWLPHLIDTREIRLTQEMCYGVLRWIHRLRAIVNILLTKPLKPKDADINILILIGLYQLLFLRIPPYAATSATVNVTRVLKKKWATQLVNGILRNFQRRHEQILTQIDLKETAKFSHPHWLLQRLKKDWPQHWQQIVQANQQHPPMTLRVNQRYIARDAYLAELQQSELSGKVIPHSDAGIILDTPVDVKKLPGFLEGWVSVQDGAAQLAAILLDVPSESDVLDACAAPGGKTAHILERHTNLRLVALDNQAQRCQQLEQTLTRLNLSATVSCADASQLSDWWQGEQFDRILLDAPCSASGVIRRHPDIKYLRQPSDLTKLVAKQKKILDALWQTLKPGGKLLYATCSVFNEENYQQIQQFLEIHSNAEIVPLPTDWGHEMPVGRQMLPGENAFDGFYYSCLIKTAVV